MSIVHFPELTPTERASLETAIDLLSFGRFEVLPNGELLDGSMTLVPWTELRFKGAQVGLRRIPSMPVELENAMNLLNFLYAASVIHAALTGEHLFWMRACFDRLAELVGVQPVERFKKELRKQFHVLSRVRHLRDTRARAYALGAKPTDHLVGWREPEHGSAS